MPTSQEYEIIMEEKLGLKKKDQYSQKELELYERLDKEYSGKDGKERLEQRKKENAEALEAIQGTMRMMREEHQKNLPNYRKQREKELTELREAYQKELEKKEPLPEGWDKMTLDEQQVARRPLSEKKSNLRHSIEGIDNLIDFAKNGTSGNRSISNIGKVYLSSPPDEAYNVMDRNASNLKSQQVELEQYKEMKKALGKDKSDLDPEKVSYAIGEYKDAKADFEKMNGAVQFFASIWGTFVSSSRFQSVERYLKMKSFEKTLKSVNIDVEEEKEPVVEEPKNNTDAREPLFPGEGKNAETSIDLQQQAPVQTKETTKNVEKTEEIGLH